MAPPKLFINTKTLDLEKQPENEKEDGFEDLQQKDEKKDKGDDNDGSDPSDGINKGNGKAKFPFPLPIFSFIVVSNGLAITLAGVSFNNHDDDLLKPDFLIPPVVFCGKMLR